jgi:hypothetical protein
MWGFCSRCHVFSRKPMATARSAGGGRAPSKHSDTIASVPRLKRVTDDAELGLPLDPKRPRKEEPGGLATPVQGRYPFFGLVWAGGGKPQDVPVSGGQNVVRPFRCHLPLPLFPLSDGIGVAPSCAGPSSVRSQVLGAVRPVRTSIAKGEVLVVVAAGEGVNAKALEAVHGRSGHARRVSAFFAGR